MPGFVLAHEIYKMTRNFDWASCEGIVLHNHGIFTFDDNAKKSYDKMIEAVSKAEKFLTENAHIVFDKREAITFDLNILKMLIEKEKGHVIVLKVNQTPLALHYATRDKLYCTARRGVLTPEHIIRTKRVPLVLEDEHIEEALGKYITEYKNYFEKFSSHEIMLNPAPNYAVIKDFGVVLFGKNEKEITILNDIVEHTMMAVLRADKLGGYKSISLRNSFEMEYWELEQAKLK